MRYYRISDGIIHAACLPALEAASGPVEAAGLDQLGAEHKQTCAHCGKPLSRTSPYTPAGIHAGLNRSQKAAFRNLKGNSRKLGRILAFNHKSGALELIGTDLLHGKTILFDPRTES